MKALDMKLVIVVLLLSWCITGTITSQTTKETAPFDAGKALFEEKQGYLAVEAENFYKQSESEVRQWYRTMDDYAPVQGRDEDGNHSETASGNTYIEILPDTRVTHDDTLIRGENFSNEAGKMAIVHYKVKINDPGRYYVWVRAFSTGTEDNGIHVGLNGKWPEHGQRMQWCDGKDKWTWASQQRTKEEHCGVPKEIYLDIVESGVHDIQFSMREDGFEFDQFILTTDVDYIPQDNPTTLSDQVATSTSKNTVSIGKTVVTIEKDKFLINGEPTYKGRVWQGHTIEGLLMNSRMVQGVFDDLNPETVNRWKYPDTNEWDADRNTDEFLKAMDDWHAKGLLAFNVNFQGGSPEGYSKVQPWENNAYESDGGLRPAYKQRMARIIEKADAMGMVVNLCLFYFGQDERLKDEQAVIAAVDNVVKWIQEKGYTNIILEIANESNNKKYDHEIIGEDRVHELILRVKKKAPKLLVSTSFNGNTLPPEKVVEVSDYVLLHGNGVHDPTRIGEMVEIVRAMSAYSPKPIVFNEDDHFDFDQPTNNFIEAVKAYASWGYFDYRKDGEGFDQGYQTVPVNWRISSARKKAFFDKLEEITGGF